MSLAKRIIAARQSGTMLPPGVIRLFSPTEEERAEIRNRESGIGNRESGRPIPTQAEAPESLLLPTPHSPFPDDWYDGAPTSVGCAHGWYRCGEVFYREGRGPFPAFVHAAEIEIVREEPVRDVRPTRQAMLF